MRLSTRWLAVFAFAALALRTAYVAAVLPAGPVFGDAWVAYSQMPSFLWFFLAGMVGARLVAARDQRSSQSAGSSGPDSTWPFVIGVAMIGVVGAASLGDDTRAMFVGPLGIALSGTVAAAVVIAAHAAPWSGWRARIATVLGDISYGTYLLHPIVWGMLIHVGLRQRNAAIVTVIAAPLIAFAVHRWFESPSGRAIKSALALRHASVRRYGADALD